MLVGPVHMMVVLAAVTTTLTMELIVGVRQGVAPEGGANPPHPVDWLRKSLEQCAYHHLEL